MVVIWGLSGINLSSFTVTTLYHTKNEYKITLLPLIQITDIPIIGAWWALMHHFLSVVCLPVTKILTRKNSYLEKYCI